MKRKAIYIILVVCSLSLFSSAKQISKGSEFDINLSECEGKKAAPCEKAARGRAVVYELSPLHLFLLSI